MIERKQSFLERLTGTHNVSHELSFEEEAPRKSPSEERNESEEFEPIEEVIEEEEIDEEPGLAIDIYESDNELVLQGMIAGVTPENLHISVTRESVTIRGKRNAPQGIPEEHYISRELYWGSFSRVIELPYEVDTEGAEAVEKYGLLIIRLPKLDVARTQELKVKSLE
jgi:HSP20 family protein